jgi:hypothetical protein
MAVAARLNPIEDLVKSGTSAFAGKTTADQWLPAAKKLNDEARVSGRLTLR